VYSICAEIIMSLTERCRRRFSADEINRGQNYFSSGRVEIDSIYPNMVVAFSEGSSYEPYRVVIDWSDIVNNSIDADCECPRRHDGVHCKHIWGTLLAIDDSIIIDRIPRNHIRHIYGIEDVDELLDSKSEIDLPTTKSTIATQTQKSNTQAPPSPSWETQLLSLSRSAGQLASPVSHNTAMPTDLAFVLNLSKTLESSGLVIEFWQRKRKRNNEWSKHSKRSLSIRDASRLSEQDGDLLKLLLRTLNDRYSHAWNSTSQVTLEPAMYDAVLPLLCVSGHFSWMLDTTIPVEEALPLRWDEAGNWSFRLTVETDEKSQTWRLGGEFWQNELVAGINEPVFTSRSGVIIFPDRIGKLANVTCIPWIRALLNSPLEIPFADRDLLLARIYSTPNVPDVVLPDELRPTERVLKPVGTLTILAPQGHQRQSVLKANLGFQYEDTRFTPTDVAKTKFDAETGQLIRRDVPAESELWQQLFQLPVSSIFEQAYESGDVEFSENSFVDIVKQLTAQQWIVESEGVRIRNAGAFSLSVSSGVDWFELDARVDFDGVAVSLPTLLSSLRAGNRLIRLDDGTHGILPEEWLQKYARLAEFATRDGDTLKFSSSQALLLDAMLEEQEHSQVDLGFKKYREKLRSFDGVAPAKEPRGFQGELREYQREGLGWLNFLRDFKFGGCLADDMGLGKTVQVLALLQSRRARRTAKDETRKPSLIVVPKSLVFNWIEEANRFAPRLRVGNFTGLQRGDLLEDSSQHDVFVTTYGTLRRDIVKLKEISFDYAILDEAQAIKNHQSQAAKACRLLSADHRLAMSGTPVENHLGELWSLFDFLNPGMLGNSSTFAAFSKSASTGDKESIKLLANAIKPFILRRTKEKVLSELPKKTEQTLQCEMSKKQRKEYDELKQYYRTMLSKKVEEKGLQKSKIHVLEALLRLRQAACHPGLIDKSKTGESSAKLDLLMEQISEVVAEGHKALIFSQFTSLLSIVRQHLDDQQITYEYLDGRTRNREEKVKRFQSDEACPLFLISLKAGGTGLNLTAADYVFILDPWWNPAVEAQAIDRAHRIGQEKPVFAYRIICKDTVEEKILLLQQEKRHLADAIISADTSLIRNLSADDLQMLLS
jgi:superfamily II DNA or RNA helicase/uncharacterized Zn finger protein